MNNLLKITLDSDLDPEKYDRFGIWNQGELFAEIESFRQHSNGYRRITLKRLLLDLEQFKGMPAKTRVSVFDDGRAELLCIWPDSNEEINYIDIPVRVETVSAYPFIGVIEAKLS